ncbi:MDR family MFS transporter [Mangrovibrevibacter kandeliae]|uniref:MDR family MFS transporter n=1 Tax=Mangrovibrevibacter kandeliae TaxID=2968473 RepID=UPI002118F346|nr:MDR family MFS transporter [Aurantimonas sp. CSK15Z-1]MCQ8783902.1 MFS transporter [Aurantimonas sp. CSK15Z-1]
MSDTPTLRRPLIIAAIMAAMAMIAIEATIVSTAMPQIAAQLGDLHLYSWVFSSFLLTQTAMTVAFGKLADLYGRRPILLLGIAIFLVGSVLCGLAWSMPSLIAFRLIQGVGAGAIQPVAITVVGDLYSVEERGKVQGWLASIWGISSVIGPLAGGLIIQHASWAWVFWINVPIGLAAGLGFVAFLHEDVAHRTRKVDALGATLFAIAVAALMVALTEVGNSTFAAVAALVVALVAGTGFFVQERIADDPMMDLKLWARRSIATANAATLLSGMTIIGLTTFLPMYVQGVLGQSPLVAGFTLTAMVFGWPIGATIAARNFKRFGLRPILLFGATLLPFGAAVFLFLRAGYPPQVAAAGSVVIGFGMGFLSNAAIVIVQSAVGWNERGAATSSNIFARNLGSTLGAVFNLSLASGGAGGRAVDFDSIQKLLEGTGGTITDAGTQAALAHSLHLTFWAMFIVSALTLVAALFVPVATPAAKSAPEDAPAEALPIVEA